MLISILKNPWSNKFVVVNDLDDFKMPYRLYGETDLEVMKAKYLKLQNISYGNRIRTYQQIR